MLTVNKLPQPAADHTTSLPRPVRIGANVVIIGLWLWLYRPVFDYLAIIFSRQDFRTNQLLLVGVSVLIALRVRKVRLRPRMGAVPQLFPPALILTLGSSALYLVVERFLDINTVSASLFGLASYGLLGLWIQPRRWREGLPAALLLIGTLPFGEHIQTFVGYPMRIFTAALVRDGLAAVGVASVGTDTILILESGVSQVDLPCSGVKSLWTGVLFLIATTWIERRPLSRRWLLIALVFAGLLFTANLARVSVLVVVGHVAGWRLAAEMLHVPLGVLGFVAACGAAAALLRLQRPTVQDERGRKQDIDPVPPEKMSGMGAAEPRLDYPAQPVLGTSSSPLVRPVWLAPILAATILAMASAYTPRPQTGLVHPPPVWEFPVGLVTQPMPFKPDEIEWLTGGGAESADRRSFEWRGITGSMILITSTTWRAHHRPERCFEVYGLSLDDSHTYLLTPDFPVRFVSLRYGGGHGLLSAMYWFQSVDCITDDYATRIWADLAPERDRWALITIVFDSMYDPHAADIQTLCIALRDAMADSLEGGTSS